MKDFHYSYQTINISGTVDNILGPDSLAGP